MRVTRVSDERAGWLLRNVLPHEPALRAWLRRRRLAGLDVDDVIQETYGRLVALESVDGIANPRAYTFQAAYSVLTSHLRRSRIVSFQTVADVDELGTAASEPSPERRVADRDELQRLAEAIAALPDGVRQVFVLRRVEDLSQREVARRLKVSESTVEKRMSRGLQLLARLFVDYGAAGGEASKTADGSTGQRHVRDRPAD